MSTRRAFLGTLGKALGAGGLLLPLAGKGALALPADLGKAAALPVTAAPLTFSAECLQLREIKRALAALPLDIQGGPRWRRMMTEEYAPVKQSLCARRVRSWTDCVELAEVIWAFWEKEHRDGYYVGPPISKLSVHPSNASVGYHQRDAIVALVEGVLALGGGERFDPRMLPYDPAEALL
jgi:hypothetical protein